MGSNFKHADHLVNKIEQALKELSELNKGGIDNTIDEQYFQVVENALNTARMAANALKRHITSK